MMRIISGSAKRRTIKVPKEVARPTTDRTREALFSILHQLVQNARCLDLFAGSGALGLEALSRGAQSCQFVDADRGSVQVIKSNLKELALVGGNVSQADVMGYVGREEDAYDVVFADPPYAKSTGDRDFVADLLTEGKLYNSLAAGGYFIAEAPSGKVAPAPDGWEIVAERSYGSCGITIYQKLEV